jgi:hypothetical protein
VGTLEHGVSQQLMELFAGNEAGTGQRDCASRGVAASERPAAALTRGRKADVELLLFHLSPPADNVIKILSSMVQVELVQTSG